MKTVQFDQIIKLINETQCNFNKAYDKQQRAFSLARRLTYNNNNFNRAMQIAWYNLGRMDACSDMYSKLFQLTKGGAEPGQ